MASPGRLVSALCWVGSLLLIVSALIHLHLWSTGYRHIPTIGPLFVAQGVVGLVVAAAVAVSRHTLVAVGGALFAASTIGGLVLSVDVGLFGFKDSFSAPYATLSLVVESAAVIVLSAAALTGLVQARRSDDFGR
jgi:vacuolar-type H+-ATPase subunit I/STV1